MCGTEISSEHNLADDAKWRRIMSDVEADKYDSSDAAPPCSLFAACRDWDDEGLPPLRGEFEPDIFVLKQIHQRTRKHVVSGHVLRYVRLSFANGCTIMIVLLLWKRRKDETENRWYLNCRRPLHWRSCGAFSFGPLCNAC